jgi:hypothetical protein
MLTLKDPLTNGIGTSGGCIRDALSWNDEPSRQGYISSIVIRGDNNPLYEKIIKNPIRLQSLCLFVEEDVEDTIVVECIQIIHVEQYDVFDSSLSLFGVTFKFLDNLNFLKEIEIDRWYHE